MPRPSLRSAASHLFTGLRNGSTRDRRSWRSRYLAPEQLEARRLMAADLPDQEIGEISQIAGLFGAQTDSAEAAAALTFTALDAGSSPSTAANIGSIDGNFSVPGTLSPFDRVDLVRFSLDRDGEVDIQLTDLTGDVSLFLVDSQGSVIGRSTRDGTSSEQISGNVEAGEFFLYAFARPFRTINYQLSITTILESEPVAPPPDTPDPDAGDGGVAPLPDVADVGGPQAFSLNAVGAPEAFAAGFTGEGVTIAIIDTGVDLDHPDLVDNLFVNAGEIPGNGIDDDGNGFIDDVNGFDFADNDGNPDDVTGHGTNVAGIVAASNNGFGATGVAPDATILPVRVLGDDGTGSTRDVADGIRYAVDQGADIINLSLGGGFSRAIESAVQYARSFGVLVVAAAGNDGGAVPGFPARFSADYDNVISVGATTPSGTLASFSNNVGNSGAVQVDAPGAGIFSTFVGGGFATLSGTSQASPHVAGIAALTLSANPDLTSAEVRDLLISGTVGRVPGSESFGSVSTINTVAYAAAGLTLVGDSTTASSVAASSTGTTTAGRFQASAAEPVQAVAPSFSATAIVDKGLLIAASPAETLDAVAGNQQSFAVATRSADSALAELFGRDDGSSVTDEAADRIVEGLLGDGPLVG